MTSPIDIYRTANQLIKQHGSDAKEVAYQRMQTLERIKEMDGVAVWRQIYRAIEELSGGDAGNSPLH